MKIILGAGCEAMKNKIKDFAKQKGADDVGIAAVADYRSPL